MNPKLLSLLFLVVVLPTALLSWGGTQLAQQQSVQLENRLRGLMRDQLTEVDSRINKYFVDQEAFLQRTTSREFSSIDSIRETADSVGVIDNIFIISNDNILTYPNLLSPLNDRELDFHARIKDIVEEGEIQNRVRKATASNAAKSSGLPIDKKMQGPDSNGNANQSEDSDASQQEQQIDLESINQNSNEPSANEPNANEPENINEPKDQVSRISGQQVAFIVQEQEDSFSSEKLLEEIQSRQATLPQASRRSPQQSASTNLYGTNAKSEGYDVCEGWFIWYWGRGVNLIFWQRLSTGNIVCVALERSRWMSDLIAELPDSIRMPGDLKKASRRSTKIVNSNGDLVYQWGGNISEGMILAAEIPVSHPLTSWKLQMWVEPEELKSESMVGLNIFLGIIASSIALVAVAWIFYREYTKDLQEASKRVSFVNQVSHELRTPLTNIRMYAELLRQQLDEMDGPDAEQAKKRIEVVESESNRLSRLIGNVLTFAGRQKDKLEIRLTNGVIDDCIRDVLSSFAPNLEKLKIVIAEDLQCNVEVRFDPDAVGQIVGNLISNVEKYAPDGEVINVSTRLENEHAVITIQDGGNGIEARHAERIFEPFWRLSNELQHASGTGIGLSISRELARMHGGDLVLEPAKKGARFVVRIKTEKVN